MERIIGVLVRVALALGFLLLTPLAVSYYFNEPLTVKLAFLVPALAIITGSAALCRRVPLSKELSLVEASVASSLSWIVTASLGALPYAASGVLNYLDAFFEAMSGFTTTGMTLIADVESIPKSILFWRALTQWIGGAGVLMFFMLIFMIGGGAGVWRLYSAEAREERFTARAWDTIKTTWLMYLFYTVLCVAALLAVGISPFDAVAHAFTMLSTGGFSTKNASIAGFNNPAAEMVVVAFMMVGGINFYVHYLILRGRFRRVVGNAEFKLLIALVVLATLVVLASLAGNASSVSEAARQALFQVASIMTTTGYTTADITAWSPLSKTTLLLLMFIGGGVCSTAGGVKVLRFLVAVKLAFRELIKTALPPGAVKPIKIGDRVFPDDDALKTLGFLALYALLVAVVSLIVASSGYGVGEAISIALSAQGNVGPTLASLSGVWPWTPPYVKLVLAIAMWIGRLELFPVVILFSRVTWRYLR